jgi:four helix bundle protein
MSYKDFTEMPVWKKAFMLMLQVYKLTEKFPKEEKYGLVQDMRRAANSVTNNISEGYGRYENHDKTRFYKISRGSCFELINQSITSLALGYINNNEKLELDDGYRDVIQSLDSIIKTLENKRKYSYKKNQ